MIRIVSDTSTLYSSAQAKEAGFTVCPLSVTIADKTYREFDEISSSDFVGIIRQGHMPTSSQPSIGSFVEAYDSFPGDQILNPAMAHGLSGTYQGATAAVDLCSHPEDITVINTRTLCGPHRYIVQLAIQMAEAGATLEELVNTINEKMDTAKSFLVPADFDYLRRGGRLSAAVAFIGKTIKLSPIMTLTEDCRRLTASAVKRSFKQAIAHVADELTKQGIGEGEGWRLYITHGEDPKKAEEAKAVLIARFPKAEYEVYTLTPAFITQGGPSCVAVQSIKLV